MIAIFNISRYVSKGECYVVMCLVVMVASRECKRE